MTGFMRVAAMVIILSVGKLYVVVMALTLLYITLPQAKSPIAVNIFLTTSRSSFCAVGSGHFVPTNTIDYHI